MDILTLELFEVTVSEALREIGRAAEEHPSLPLRILLGSDRMLHHNVRRLLERLGRSAVLRQEGTVWRMEVAGASTAAADPGVPDHGVPDHGVPDHGVPDPGVPDHPVPGRPAGWSSPAAAVPAPAPPPETPPLLVTRSYLGPGGLDMGRRLLLGLLRELDPGVPWVGLALGGMELLEDPQAVAVLEQLQARGTGIRISRESQLFALAPPLFEIMEDSLWQRLAGRGRLTIL